MSKLINLIGQRFGSLEVIERAESKNGKTFWKCKCDCGNEVTVFGYYLRSGHTKSCGCLRKQRNNSFKNEVGKKYNHLTVIKEYGRKEGIKSDHIYWECECDCINHTRLIVDGTKLRNGHTTSCGCVTKSKGEEKIKDILTLNNISFIREKTFDNFKYENNSTPRFDFYVNNKYLIEYDGIQHFKSTGGWSTEEYLKNVTKKDKIKNEYCKDNNIPLIRIPYTYYDDLCLEDLLLETTKYRVV